MARQSILLFCLLLPFVPILLVSALSSLPIFFIGFPLILLNVLLYILYGIIKAFIKRAYSDQSHPSGDILLPSPVLKAADPITIVKLPSSRGFEPPDMDRDESSEPMPPRWMSASLPTLNISFEGERGSFKGIRLDQGLSAESILDLNRPFNIND